MKRIFLLLAVVLSVFCFGSAAMAEGFTVGGDLTMGTPNDSGSDKDQLGYLTVGGEKDLDPFIIGGSVIIGVYIDPPLADNEEAFNYLLGVYGGYKLLGDEAFGLAAVAGYYAYNQTFSDGTFDLEWKASSLMAGIKAAADFDPFSASLTYLYGVSPEATLDTGAPAALESADPGLTILEIKGAYAFNEAWSLSLVYRNFSVVGITFKGVVVDGVDLGSSVFGAGLTYKF